MKDNDDQLTRSPAQQAEPASRCPSCGAALGIIGSDWHQVLVRFPSWDTAEQIAASQFRPWLLRAQTDGTIEDWWFLRKHPHWRFRFRPRADTPIAQLKDCISANLNDLRQGGLISQWRPGIYEPETLAFGGPHGIDIAHRLFHADSLGVLDYVHRSGATGFPGGIGRRELSVLLCSAMLQGAGQDRYEQGDIWHRVAQMRPVPPDADRSHPATFSNALRRLLSQRIVPGTGLLADGAPLVSVNGWASAFSAAGSALGSAACQGNLQRGLRDILAHLIIFHWNRLGLTGNSQAILARGLQNTIMDPARSGSVAGGDR